MKKKSKRTIRTVAEHILCINIESTCWATPKDVPPGQKHEIIKIGAALVDLSTLTISKHKDIIIKPTTAKVSKFCEYITGMTQEDVDAGISFREACDILTNEFKSKDTPWYAWGEYDKKHFQFQCDDMKVPYPFGAGFTNCQSLIPVMFGLSEKPKTVEMMKVLGLKPEDHSVKNLANIITTIYGKARELVVGGNNGKEAEETKE